MNLGNSEAKERGELEEPDVKQNILQTREHLPGNPSALPGPSSATLC